MTCEKIFSSFLNIGEVPRHFQEKIYGYGRDKGQIGTCFKVQVCFAKVEDT
jgi:hypothetical protein